MISPTRFQFDGPIPEQTLQELVGNPRLEVLQCSVPVDTSVWARLNESFFTARPDVSLRVYGHYSTDCDLSFARYAPNVRHFSADCLMRATNVEAIAEIPRLESLSLGIYDLESFRVLELIPGTLTSLALGTTKSKKPNLIPLDRFRSLRVLHLEGQSKGIEVLSRLQELEDVTLRSITTPDLGYLAPLKKLWSLDIKLGGIRSFRGIEGKESIKYLEIWQVRELNHVDIIADLPKLQNLFLQSLPLIKSLPQLAKAMFLRRMVLENLKGMQDFSAVEKAPTLEEFALIVGNKQTPDQLLPVLRNANVRRVSAHFGSDRKNEAFTRLAEKYGKSHWDFLKPFEYR